MSQMANNIGWIFAGALYVLAAYGIHVMSRDFSTKKRHWLTWVAIVFWPLAVIVGVIGDLSDYIERIKGRT